MQNQEGELVDGQKASEFEDWSSFGDDDIMKQHSAIRSAEADKIPFLGDKVFFFSISIACLLFHFQLFFFLMHRFIAGASFCISR